MLSEILEGLRGLLADWVGKKHIAKRRDLLCQFLSIQNTGITSKYQHPVASLGIGKNLRAIGIIILPQHELGRSKDVCLLFKSNSAILRSGCKWRHLGRHCASAFLEIFLHGFHGAVVAAHGLYKIAHQFG